VEDHEDLRRTLGSFLAENFTVLGARNGLEAMNSLHSGQIPDVIVTDASMPEMDGAALIYHLRCSGLWADIPVLVLGASEDEAEGLQFEQLGAQGYFPKPFSPGKLQERIQELLS
jgi:CheY-like chemotaxis protein